MINKRSAFRLFLALSLTFAGPLSASKWLSAPVPNSKPVNQRQVAGNACGPACVMDAFRSGSEKWRASIARVAGKSDSERLKKLLFTYGKRPSKINPKRARWTPRYGINGEDLASFANELRIQSRMGKVKQEIYFKKGRESSHSLLKRVHKNLSRSLAKGLPPIIRVRRVAYRTVPGSSTKAWLAVKRHYLVITGIPEKIPSGCTSFQVTYHDPWGGKKFQGTVKISDASTSGVGTVVADFPQSTIGKSSIKKGEPTALSLSSAIGLF